MAQQQPRKVAEYDREPHQPTRTSRLSVVVITTGSVFAVMVTLTALNCA
jgi:hypothetical protein